MNKTKFPPSVSSIEATLKRFDNEEVALQKELSGYLAKMYSLQLKRAQAMGRLKKAQGLRNEQS